MPLAGKVNETLSRTMAYGGDDGLSDAERLAYDRCKQLSCRHESCYKRYMYSPPEKQKRECEPLMAEWRKCFDEARTAMLAERQSPAPSR